jgi:tetratricopeptide (TPR) repeat protein
MLDPAAATVAERFPDNPMVEAAIRHVLAICYSSLGHVELGLPHARASLEILSRSLGPDHPKMLRAMNNTAAYLHRIGQFTEAESLYREALQRRRRVLGNKDPETLATIYNLGYLLWAQGKLSEAEPLCREALDGCRTVHGNDHEETLGAMTNVANVLFTLGKRPEAASLFLEGLALSRRVRGDDHPLTMIAMNNVGWVLLTNGNFTDAQNLLSEALRRRRSVLGDDHPDTLSALFNLGSLFEKQENFAHAEPLFAEMYQRILVSQIPAPYIAEAISHYGPCLVKLGRYTDAEQPLREAERRLRETGQSQTENMGRVLSGLAEMCDHTKRPDEGVKWRGDLAKLQAATQPSLPHGTQPTTAPTAS